ncbi:hypothetical protein PsorP6_001608 [Peronosclerospora sorghi]|uniref:Uncharacterized protein n=1 Tax=Peronosclerospora sorghi TaxID=230839 RepID=A0ACC0WV90_9STRA|nr:hypothetical protein PsorP6_001608 [Peronosclerospora sorghi]
MFPQHSEVFVRNLFTVWRNKVYATRDSNPQPPDSKSDTLSIAPAALLLLTTLIRHYIHSNLNSI